MAASRCSLVSAVPLLGVFCSVVMPIVPPVVSRWPFSHGCGFFGSRPLLRLALSSLLRLLPGFLACTVCCCACERSAFCASSVGLALLIGSAFSIVLSSLVASSFSSILGCCHTAFFGHHLLKVVVGSVRLTLAEGVVVSGRAGFFQAESAVGSV